MGEDRLRSIFAEGQLERALENCIDNLQVNEVHQLLDFDTFFELLDEARNSSDEANLERLVELRLASKHGQGYSISNGAAILLAKDLTQFPTLSRKAPRLIVYNGNDKLDPRYDRVGQLGYAVGFSSLVKTCMQFMPANEVVRDALREVVPLFPERALREIVANALVHQDFRATGTSPTIEIFGNRIEVSNAGEPIVPVERFIDGQRSRNEKLAFIMRQLKICEERSSGIDRVVRTAEMYQLPAPEFISGFESTMVVVH